MTGSTDSRGYKLDPTVAAQAIAFGPLIFQAARVLRDSGILQLLMEHPDGHEDVEVARLTSMSVYSARILLEAGLVAGMLELEDGRYRITVVGRIIQRDRMTRINMDFVHDVCYRAGFHLEEALREGKPAGLKEIGDWPTVYEGLSECTEQFRKSWFAFDHYYSELSFRRALPEVFRHDPRSLLDVGGNTGRWALKCCEYDPHVRITILDLPGQLNDARVAIEKAGAMDRVTLHAGNLLDPEVEMPTGFDAIWMSQFLDCFSEEQILTILERSAKALAPGGRLHILETYWDRQPNETARYCVVGTSLYFAVVANGNSKMYHSNRLIDLLGRAGFRIVRDVDNLGAGHTLLTCEHVGIDHPQ
jgi:ubiquinone/menaquinone biosynthesis C-methylase UbiE